MQAIARKEAINLFGREIIIRTYNLPNYEYLEHRSQIQLEMEADLWESKQNRSPIIKLEEVLGRSTNQYTKHDIINKNNWGTFINDLFEGNDNLPDKDIADAIRNHAVKVYDEARVKFELQQKLETPKGIFARISNALSKDVPLPNGNSLFAKLKVETSYLPETINIPEATLNIGDFVYQVLSHDIKNNGTSIVEHKVVDIRPQKATKTEPKHDTSCSCDFNVVRMDDTYDIKYTVKRDGSEIPIHFELNDNGSFKKLTTGDCFNPGGHFFLTSKAAKNWENKIWWDVEKKLKKYRDKTKTPSPS